MVIRKGVVGRVGILVTFRELLLVPHVDDHPKLVETSNARLDTAFDTS